jgi:hypothetical protein
MTVCCRIKGKRIFILRYVQFRSISEEKKIEFYKNQFNLEATSDMNTYFDKTS